MADNTAFPQVDLEHVFYPKSVAVLGTNRVAGTVPHDIFANILKDNFQGIVYPVSPKERSVAGVRAYKYVVDIPDPVDLAILVFPSTVCNLALEQCGQKGVKSAIIISAGFREIGPAGVKREEEIKEIAKKYNISFIGPNCLGVINTDPLSRLNASFARKMPQEGSIAFLSQSGALCTAVLDYAQAKHIGFSKFVSFGNKASISEIDLMRYLKNDPKTKVILIYLEEITDGAGLMNTAREIITETGKPVLILKSGRTREGAAAAASHTGSLAGSDEVCDAAFKQAGIIRCTTIEEMFNSAIALAYQPVPQGKRVAIITNAGGPGVLATDATIAQHLELAKFSAETTEIYKKTLPATANIKNPVDVIGDARADRYRVALGSALADPGVDGVFVILTPQSMTDIENIAREVCATIGKYNKPGYASFMGEQDVAVGINILQQQSIPHYILPESMCRAYASALFFREHRDQTVEQQTEFSGIDKPKAVKVIQDALAAGRKYLPEEESDIVLNAFGLPMLPSGLAHSSDEARKMAEDIGFPVVMKVVSDDIIHKFDVKGVLLDIRSAEAAGDAYDTILRNIAAAKPDAKIKGILIQKMVTRGEEVILGVKRDPSFGAVIMFGLGGLFVEVFKDVSFRVAPVGPRAAGGMIREIRAYSMLAGARGKKPRDIKSVEEAIQRLSLLALELPEIKELDINPLIVNDEGSGCYVADARIML
ncbi:MAG TPA: acyl-CoA synthetase [Bacteroidetes bacterium]|nr:MAG: acyl-CoA synthetase [Ignavibacteria bacterium GWA2_54_16]HCA81398.1 acyl-CoA synthetase [Bacteroidota bacterium]